MRFQGHLLPHDPVVSVIVDPVVGDDGEAEDHENAEEGCHAGHDAAVPLAGGAAGPGADVGSLGGVQLSAEGVEFLGFAGGVGGVGGFGEEGLFFHG